ncbi:MAG: AAA family ATPase, partial [Bacteroidales bacterium]|nr:AAA family ATPase [Bacteroidales bacterium]
DRFLPDKAIDLIDEAAAKLRLEIDSLPEELDELERKIRQLEIEREAIKREHDTEKVKNLSKEIANLNEQRNQLKAAWMQEKEIINQISLEKENIEEYKLDAERAERDGDYGKVAELRYGNIKQSEENIINLKQKLSNIQADKPLINEEVDSDEIAEVVARWTGIPVNKMLQSEREKLLHLEEELHKRVIGQDEAINALADAIRRSRAGLQDAKRPIGSFIFLGSTGVGKTELAKAMADYLFNDENSMVRIDMSEYQERHTVSRLIGAPPGYVGYEEGGQLTEAVRRKPYSVILLDEIEKAHPDVFNILLQVLDDGRLTDNKGRIADFKNTIIILTSNIGSHLIMEKLANGESNDNPDLEETEKEVYALLKKSIRPEFLNRIDETIMFKPLNQSEIKDVVRLQFNSIVNMLKKESIDMEITEQTIDKISKLGYDPQYGARPVKRVIQRQILNELSKMILAGKVNRKHKIIIDYDGNKFLFNNN